MDFKFYVQKYANDRANSILPVPENYPLRGDFGADFISDFTELTAILKKIYLDAAENPDAYECERYPLDHDERGKGADNESNTSLDRIVKCLRILCDCGELNKYTLEVKTDTFNKQIKKVNNYLAILNRLKDFGFAFQGDISSKTENFLGIMYPEKPGIINALKIYMDCWNDVLKDEYLKNEIKKNGYGCIAYYYKYYLFDYKVTANPEKLDPMRLIEDLCYTWNIKSKKIYIDFYEYSLKYSAIRFSQGEYYIGRKRICTFTYDESRLILKLKLKNPGKYISEIEELPRNLRERFAEKAVKCSGCGCFGKEPDMCNNRIYWTLSGVDYIGCSMGSFYFGNVGDNDIPCLFALLECEYNIKKK